MASLSEQVANLERENVRLRSGWCSDLEVLIALAEKHGESRIVKEAGNCLANLRRHKEPVVA